jgi:hypothetical protein
LTRARSSCHRASTTVGQFVVVGEVLFPLWLLIEGVNVERRRQATAAAA